ncbi:MAG: hypothetical protein V2J14_10045 [Erythrobacter sp.]|jgi:hypothetical protein|nr:hypothetical protein [Erythrobacter sp.]
MRSIFLAAALSSLALGASASAQVAGPDYHAGPFNPAAGCSGGCSADRDVLTDFADVRISESYYTLRRIRAGERALRARNYDRAIRYFSLALEDRPEDTGIRFLIGAAHYLNGDDANAQSLLSSALGEPASLNETQRKFAERMLADLAAR